jgi:hypothetical protein
MTGAHDARRAVRTPQQTSQCPQTQALVRVEMPPDHRRRREALP